MTPLLPVYVLALMGSSVLKSVPQNQDPDRIQQLEIRLDALAAELERANIGVPAEVLGDGIGGLAPGASQIYRSDEGEVSLGGYGETLMQFKPGATDVFDALRTVIYMGYKFDDKWLLNTEIEFEHGTTSSSSGTSSGGGSASAEFVYLDYQYSEQHAARVGLVLVPMGLVNEMHEPTTYMTARRSRTETNILPSTWREMGVGLTGDNGEWAYRAYVLNGLNGSEFDDGGLRSGRQKGNRAAAESLAVVARLDYIGSPGLMLGGSVYSGDSGQESAPGDVDLDTTIVELHAEYKRGPFTMRALYAMADIGDADDFNTAVIGAGDPNPSLANELNGGYLELGYNLFASRDTAQSLTPFVRYETVDTQADLPNSAVAGRGLDDDILTFGLAWNPTEQVIIKVDYEDWDDSDDVWNIQIGYVF
ncbi:MAG: hypothetical protein ACI8QC_003967 [Planctomycetota bacterium]|jgi:hypothetical protein